MSVDEYIVAAIETGARQDLVSMEPTARLICLISEAEILSDMQGIDSFLDRYAPEWLPETTSAFEAVGATEIAAGFRPIVAGSSGEADRARLNDLITARAGYSYADICRVVETRIKA